MSQFPRTEVGGISLSRMLIGTNWLMGWSHCTRTKDQFIREYACNSKHIASVLEVFFRAGVDTIMGNIEHDPLYDGIREAEDRTGVQAIFISTPGFAPNAQTPERGFDPAVVEPMLKLTAERGTKICMPHMMTTDAMVDRCTHKIRHMDSLCARIRAYGMIPGLSTHMPETIVYADRERPRCGNVHLHLQFRRFPHAARSRLGAADYPQCPETGDDDKTDGRRADPPTTGADLLLERDPPAGYGDRRHYDSGRGAGVDRPVAANSAGAGAEGRIADDALESDGDAAVTAHVQILNLLLNLLLNLIYFPLTVQFMRRLSKRLSKRLSICACAINTGVQGK